MGTLITGQLRDWLGSCGIVLAARLLPGFSRN